MPSEDASVSLAREKTVITCEEEGRDLGRKEDMAGKKRERGERGT